jgi:molybdenum cofactor cytidylyltransferase
MTIVGILLAAGTGSRFGGHKLLAPMSAGDKLPPPMSGDTPLGAVAARNLAAALPRSLAVVRPSDARLSARLAATGLQVVECADADTGMGASLACGVAAAQDADGWVVALGDMPWIAPATIRSVADALRSGADIAAPSFQGRRGHPVGLSRHHYAALTALTGDTGARALLEENRDRVTLIDVADAGVLRDVDTPQDLA